MVELQRSIAHRDESVAAYALSYDPVQTLHRFAEAHGITYPLLSDVGSRVIERLGILNTTIEAERAAYGRKMEPRHYGLPYPGTFTLDEGGVVMDRHFEQSHRVRPTTNTLLADLTGEGSTAVTATASAPGVDVAAWLEADTVSANQLQRLTLALRMDPHVHLYVPPVPDGYTALEITVAAPAALQVRMPAMPLGRPFTVAGLDEQFQVVVDEVRIAIPFFVDTDRDTAGDADTRIDLTVEVAFQACTDETCFMPERLSLTLPFRLTGNPEYEELNDKSVRPLMIRRLDERPHSVESLHHEVQRALTEELSRSQVERLLEEMAEAGLAAATDEVWHIVRPG